MVRIFEPEEPKEAVNIEENYILNEPELDEPRTKKRKIIHIQRNRAGKYQCQQCDYEASLSRNLRRHVEAKHDGVCYSCTQCGYKASREDGLKIHVASIMKVSVILVINVITKLQRKVI